MSAQAPSPSNRRPKHRKNRWNMDDLSTLLTFEVKKEIADRYFGFRKLIEEDSHLFRQQIIALSLDLETSIGFDLVRIYTLLQDDDLIRAFFLRSGLSERLFFECSINKSARLRKKTFSGLRIHGLTKKACFLNMFFDTYAALHDHVEGYRSTLGKLAENHDTLQEQINLFYRKNDITGIMQFLRGLDRNTDGDFGTLGQVENAGFHDSLTEKMRLRPPDPVEDLLPHIPAIPPLQEVRADLKRIVLTAWERRPGLDPRRM